MKSQVPLAALIMVLDLFVGSYVMSLVLLCPLWVAPVPTYLYVMLRKPPPSEDEVNDEAERLRNGSASLNAPIRGLALRTMIAIGALAARGAY